MLNKVCIISDAHSTIMQERDHCGYVISGEKQYFSKDIPDWRAIRKGVTQPPY